MSLRELPKDTHEGEDYDRWLFEIRRAEWEEEQALGGDESE